MQLKTLSRRYWRVLAPKWSREPLSGAGATRNGGRYNPKGTPALYLSADLMTAVAEYEQELGVRPGTFCAYTVQARKIADLTNEQVLADLKIGSAELHAPWQQIVFVDRAEPATWQLAARLIGEGAAGAIVPSVRWKSGSNLVLWRWNQGNDVHVLPLDPMNDLQDPS